MSDDSSDAAARQGLINKSKSDDLNAQDIARTLANDWPDEKTRQSLEEVAKLDQDRAVAAVEALVNRWPDERTRQMLEDLAKSNMEVAVTAVKHLGNLQWSKQVVQEVAKSGTRGASAAITVLANVWDDIATVEEIAKSDAESASVAVGEYVRVMKNRETLYLSITNSDDSSRLNEVLVGIAKSGKRGAESAISELTRALQNSYYSFDIRGLLEEVARSGKHGAAAAVTELVDGWYDYRTQTLLEEVAKSNGDGSVQARQRLQDPFSMAPPRPNNYSSIHSLQPLFSPLTTDASLATTSRSPSTSSLYTESRYRPFSNFTQMLHYPLYSRPPVHNLPSFNDDSAFSAVLQSDSDADEWGEQLAEIDNEMYGITPVESSNANTWKTAQPKSLNPSSTSSTSIKMDVDKSESQFLEEFEEDCARLVEGNRQCFQAWVRKNRHTLKNEDGLWLVFQNLDPEPVPRKGKSLEDAWKDIIGVAFVGHADDDLDSGLPAFAGIAQSHPARFEHTHDTIVEVRSVPGAPSQRHILRGEFTAKNPGRDVPAKYLVEPEMKVCQGIEALVDTGATHVHMLDEIIDALDLAFHRNIPVTLANGKEEIYKSHFGQVKVDREWHQARILRSAARILGRAVLKELDMTWPAGSHCELEDV